MIKLIKSTFYSEKDTRSKLAKFVLNSKIFSMHKECKKFEENFAKKQNRKFAVFVCSGSVANLALIQSLLNLGRLKKGDRVGVSALTWATNVMPLIQLGFIPMALDCELKTLNVSPKNLKKHIDDLNCLFITNVLGFCDHLDEISNLCQKNNIFFLEDNCESLGSKAFGRLLGNFGTASTFSFYVGHHLSTIEGGMVCTDDEELYEMLLLVRAHGWVRNLSEERQQSLRSLNNINDFFSRYTFYDLAYNLRPTEINGFIGNIQINYWDEIVSKRVENFEKFHNTIKQNPDFINLEVGHMDIISNFAMPILCKNEDLFEKYRKKFEKNRIEIRPIIAGNIAKQPFYKKYINNTNKCKNADFIHKNGFYFGNNPEMTDREITKIIDVLSLNVN